MRALSPPARLLAAGLIDWTGTGFYLAISAIFLTRAVGLTPAQAQRAAGVLLAACCACLAGSAVGSRELSTLLLVAAVLCLTAGELLKASAAWQITFTLAPPARAAEFFATYGLGRVAAQIGGPVLVTAVVLALGSAGWLLLAAVFVAGAGVTPPLARAARARPVVARRPPREQPPYRPLLARA